MIAAQALLQLHVERAWSEGCINFNPLGDKLFGKLRNVLGEPAIERDCLHVIRGAENDNKI